MKRYGIVPRKENRKMKVSGTIDDDLYRWMQKRIEDGTYYNASHVIQQGLQRLRSDNRRE